MAAGAAKRRVRHAAAILRRVKRGVVESTRLTLEVRELKEAVRGLREDLGSESQVSRPTSHLGRLEATQALVARTYEAGFRWDEQVRAMRLEEGYEAPWEESEPLISVRVATYDNAKVLVERALASVLRQTYTNWEAVVVGDACTDDTAERVAALGDPRIRFENLPFRGPYPRDETAFWHVAGAPPMNRGLELARGAWVAAIDHDDEWDDDHLEVLLDEARRTRAEVVYAGWRMVDDERGRMIDHRFGGVYPPVDGAIAFQTTLCHGGLARFRLDMNAYLAGEPADRNLGRRLWDAGVRFAVLERPVTTYWFSPRSAWGREYLDRIRATYGYVDDA
jgi:hypothetical protein